MRPRSPQVAACLTTFTTAGTHPITVTYRGDTTLADATATPALASWL